MAGHGDGEDATFIQPPDTLSGKVKASPGAGVDEATLAKAEALIANLQDDYLVWAEEDVRHLSRALENLEAGPADVPAAVSELFRVAHDMKGQGGSFGYDLVTVVGDRLCRYVESMKGNPTPGQLKVLRLHVETMRLIIARRIQGDGGKAGSALVSGLDQVIEKVKV